MKEIHTKEYFGRFKEDINKGEFFLAKEKILLKAFETALDTRKFEIELYWKRATYFWAFIAAMFIAYFAVFNSDKIDEIRGVTILISSLGYFFSLGWYFVNRGSKYWQKNWESHVDLLGAKIQGKLFSTIKNSNQEFIKLDKEYPFSVSKVNQLLSLIMLVTWFGLIIFSIFFSFDKLIYFSNISDNWFLFGTILILSIIILVSFIFFNYSKSFIMDHKINDKNTTFFLND
ncbi:hypothetical protein ACHRVW_11430 [Flavobacterium collinsii]|uniref:RipA family octameric membrane protein n=1 Tax=Flavobacterium collinsii TaxID=1114861 RepID=UPI003757E790